MTTFTWGDILARVVDDLDLQEEVFADDEEMLAIANSAINEIESIVHKLNEDYYLSRTTITLASGTATYDLPTEIFANKLRKVYYINGSTKYRVERIKQLDDTLNFCTSDDYEYLIINQPGQDPKIEFYPTPAESGAFIQVWYLRNATRIVDETTEIDVPEAMEFIIQFVKEKITNKERFDPLAAPSPEMMKQTQILVDALTDRTPDENTELSLGDRRCMLEEAV